MYSTRNDCQQYFVDAHEGLCQIFLDNVVNAELLPPARLLPGLDR